MSPFRCRKAFLPDLRQALTNETATIEAIIPGDPRRATGQVTMIENSVDAPTGTVPVRATMPNADELLWPGTLVNTQLTLRTEEGVTVPATALQLSQAGNFVFVVKDDVATVRPVKVERTVDGESVIEVRPRRRGSGGDGRPAAAFERNPGDAAQEGQLLT